MTDRNEMGMVERVAAAQFKVFSAGMVLENYPDHAPIWNDIARAGIEAIREPTDEMNFKGNLVGDYPWDGKKPSRIFVAMIDAALNDEVKG